MSIEVIALSLTIATIFFHIGKYLGSYEKRLSSVEKTVHKHGLILIKNSEKN